MATVAVLGTGIMGGPMARNIAAAGHEVRAWNRTRAKAEPLTGHGVTVVDEPAQAAEGADLVMTMLTDADAVAAVVGELPFGDAVWLQMSTVGVAGERRLRELAEARGIAYVDCPVLGTRAPAEQAALVVLAAGAPAYRDRAAAVFDAVGQRTTWLADEPGAASALKMVVNSWVLALTDAVGEAIALAQGLGLAPEQFLDTIKGSATDSAYAHVKGGAILAGDFTPSFGLGVAEKDARLIVEAGEEAGVTMSLARAVRADFARGVELGHGDEDMAAVYHVHRPPAS